MTEQELVTELTAAMRKADLDFQRVGGSTRNHVRDCLLPAMRERGLRIVRDAPCQSPSDHGFTADCWCNPTEITPGVFVHLEVPIEPTKEMRMAGASRLASVESADDWPNKFDGLQVASMCILADRVWRSMLLEWCASRHHDTAV